MDELIKLLDKNLDYVEHEIIDNTIYVKVISNRENVCCKYCNTPSKKVHSRYNRSFQDLPIQGKKVITHISYNIYFQTSMQSYN
jgi:hypothetical protein